MPRSNFNSICVLSVLALLLPAGTFGQAPSKELTRDPVVFEGTVLKVGTWPNGASGGIEVYQLAKYQINRLVRGQFSGSNILVDHLLLTGNELKKLKRGQRVCVTFFATEDIGHRYDDEILRKSSDEPKFFYIGTVHTRIVQSPCRVT